MDLHFSHFEIMTGSVAFALCLAFACAMLEAGAIEEDVAQRAHEAVEAEQLYWVSVEPSGQVVRLGGAAASFEARVRAVEVVENLWGVSAVESEIAVIGEAGTCQQEFNEVLGQDTVLFKSGRAEISESSHELLRMLATIVRNCGARVEIAGHTDARGEAGVNLALSQRRAETVRAHLIGSGAEGRLISARGYGESQPLADNRTEAGRQDNRRIEFRVLGAAT
jgi:outer membrane protein OmpA-like peptidoglycan-associated protein